MSDKIHLTPDVGPDVSQGLGLSEPRFSEKALTKSERMMLDKAVQISPNSSLIDRYDSVRDAARASLISRSPHLLSDVDSRAMSALSGSPFSGDIGGNVLNFIASGMDGLGSISKSAWGSASEDSKDTLKKVGTAAGALGMGVLGAKALSGLAPSMLMRNSFMTPQTSQSDYDGVQSWANSPKSGSFGSGSEGVVDVSSPDVLKVPVAFYQKMADLGKAYAVRAEDEAIESLAGDPVLAATHPSMMGHIKYPPVYLTPDGKTLPTVHAFSALQGGWFKNIAKKVSSGVKKASSWVSKTAKKGVETVKKAAPVIQKVAGVASLVAPLIPGGAAAMPVLQQVSSAAGNVANMANTYGDKIISVADKARGVADKVGGVVDGLTGSQPHSSPVPDASPELVSPSVINQGIRMAPEVPISQQLPLANPAQSPLVDVSNSQIVPTQVKVGKASAMSLVADDPSDLSWKKRKDEDDVINAELQVIGDSELAGWAWLRPLLTKAGSAALKYIVLPAVVEKGTQAFTKSVSGKGITPTAGKVIAFDSATASPLSQMGKTKPIVDGVVTQAALSAGPRWYSKLLDFAKKGFKNVLGPILKTKNGKIAMAAGALLSIGFIRAKNDERKKTFLALVREQFEGSEYLQEWDELSPLIMDDETMTPSQVAHASDLCGMAYAKALALVEAGKASANDAALVESYREMTQSLESVDPVTASRLAELSEDMANSMGPEDLDDSLSMPSGFGSDAANATESEDEPEITSAEDALNSLDPSQAMLLKASISEGQDPDKVLSLLKSFGLPAAAIGLLTPLLISAVKKVKQGLPAVYGDNPSQDSILVRLFGKGGRHG